MVFTPLFIIIAVIAFGQKITSIFHAVRQKNIGKMRAEIFILSIMLLTVSFIYLIIK